MMATNAPIHHCMFCNQRIEYESVPHYLEAWEPIVFGPTDWSPLPHKCPPGSFEKLRVEHLTTTDQFFIKVGT